MLPRPNPGSFLLGETTRRAWNRLCHSSRAGGALGSPVENKMRNNVPTSWLPPVTTAQADDLLSDGALGYTRMASGPVTQSGTLKNCLSSASTYRWRGLSGGRGPLLPQSLPTAPTSSGAQPTVDAGDSLIDADEALLLYGTEYPPVRGR